MEDVYIDLLNRRAYEELEALATQQLTRAEDALSVLMIAHSRIRRGLFNQALEPLYELERLSPSKQAFVHDTVAMCIREEEQIAIESDAAERERLNDMDLWHGRPASADVCGRMLLTDGRHLDFTDAADIDADVGRRLLVFGRDRAWRIPFEAISAFELAPKSPMLFHDIWIPVRVSMRDGEGLQQISAQIPAFYKRSLDHTDPQVAAGRVTNMDGPAPMGLRDYRFSADGKSGLFGIYQIQSMVFPGGRPATSSMEPSAEEASLLSVIYMRDGAYLKATYPIGTDEMVARKAAATLSHDVGRVMLSAGRTPIYFYERDNMGVVSERRA